MQYEVTCTKIPATPTARWSPDFWEPIPAVELRSFRPESSSHRPVTHARLIFDDRGIAGYFTVRDRYVRSVLTELNGPVCTDSCVEFFVAPDVGTGYFNFEFNCGGTMLCSHVIDPRRSGNGFNEWRSVGPEDAKLVECHHTMPAVVDPEITEPVDWQLGFHVPFTLFERYFGALGDLRGRTWRANFYKCGDRTSHPHWASWSPVDRLDFHMPTCFSDLLFADGSES